MYKIYKSNMWNDKLIYLEKVDTIEKARERETFYIRCGVVNDYTNYIQCYNNCNQLDLND